MMHNTHLTHPPTRTHTHTHTHPSSMNYQVTYKHCASCIDAFKTCLYYILHSHLPHTSMMHNKHLTHPPTRTHTHTNSMNNQVTNKHCASCIDAFKTCLCYIQHSHLPHTSMMHNTQLTHTPILHHCITASSITASLHLADV